MFPFFFPDSFSLKKELPTCHIFRLSKLAKKTMHYLLSKKAFYRDKY